METKNTLLFISIEVEDIDYILKELHNINFSPSVVIKQETGDALLYLNNNNPDIIICGSTLRSDCIDSLINSVFKLDKQPLIFFISDISNFELIFEPIEHKNIFFLEKNKFNNFISLIQKELFSDEIIQSEENELPAKVELNHSIFSTTQGLDIKIIQNISDMVFLLDARTFELLYLNKSAENTTGYTENEIIGKNKYEFLSKNFSAYYIDNSKAFAISNNDFDMFEEFIRTKNNELKLFQTKKYKIKDQQNNLKYILEIAENITDRKKTESSLLKSESLFLKLFQSSPIATAIIDYSNFNLININQAYQNIFGYNRQELIGANFIEYGFFGNTPAELVLNIEKIKQSQNTAQREFQIRRKDGSYVNCIISIEQLLTDDDLPLLIFIAQDVTEIRKAEQKKLSAIEQENELQMLRSRFISMLSHEFRTPLTTIMLSTDLLKNYGGRWTEAEKSQYYKRITDTVLHLNQLIEKLLTIGSIESGRFDFQPENIDIPAFFQSIVDNMAFTIGNEHPIKFKYSGNYNNTYIDENLISLIVTNLISNAAKYSNKGSDILFDSTCDGVYLTFQIKDKGVGIPAEDLKNLFQTFYRASNVGKTSGYGLGLAIVKKCVDAHHGEIFVESKEQVGTTFIVKIPIVNK